MTKDVTEFGGFDVAQLDTTTASNAGAEFELIDVNGNRTGILWGVLGKDGEVFRSIMKDRADEMIRKMALAEQTGQSPEPISAAQQEARSLELLAACSTHWRTVKRDVKGEITAEKPTITFKGEELSFNVPNALKLLEFLPIRKQVDTAIGNLSLFTEASR